MLRTIFQPKSNLNLNWPRPCNETIFCGRLTTSKLGSWTFFNSCLKPFRVERVKDIQKNKKPTKNYNGHMFVTFKKIFVEVFTQEKNIDIINVTIKKCWVNVKCQTREIFSMKNYTHSFFKYRHLHYTFKSINVLNILTWFRFT